MAGIVSQVDRSALVLVRFGGEVTVNKFFHWLDKVSSGTNKVFIFIASLMMAGLMIIVCVDLTLRYVFNSPLIWGTEVTEILLLYITLLGAAQVFREDSHVVIDSSSRFWEFPAAKNPGPDQLPFRGHCGRDPRLLRLQHHLQSLCEGRVQSNDHRNAYRLDPRDHPTGVRSPLAGSDIESPQAGSTGVTPWTGGCCLS